MSMFSEEMIQKWGLCLKYEKFQSTYQVRKEIEKMEKRCADPAELGKTVSFHLTVGVHT